MACAPQTLDGCKIEVGTAVTVVDCSTDLVAADYSGVADWTVVGAIETGGFSGQEWATTDFSPLAGGSKISKGGFNSGTLDATIAWDVTDAGMVILETSYASKTLENAIKITYPNGEIYFAQGLVTKLLLPSGGQDDVMMRELTIGLNHRPST